MSESALDRIHHDLKILASLHANDKIYVRDGMLCVLPPSVTGALWRWARGDNRTKSLQMIESVISEALSVAECCMERLGKSEANSSFQWRRSSDEAYRATVKRFYQELQGAIVGLRRLRITYTSDPSTSARIDVLREKTSERLTMIVRWLRGVGEMEENSSPCHDSSSSSPPRIVSSLISHHRECEGVLAIEDINGCLVASEFD